MTTGKIKIKKTWHIRLNDGTILSYKTKKHAKQACYAIHGVDDRVWCSSVEWME